MNIKKQLKKLNKSHVFQQEQSDCGVACLLMLTRYYGGNNTLEKIRASSGTSTEGTTLLGMYQAAQALGFKAEGCKADIAALISHGKPLILHLTLEQGLQHYVVVCPPSSQHEAVFLIADPAKGVYQLSGEALEKFNGFPKKCLILSPNDTFQTNKYRNLHKRRWLYQLIKEDIGILSIGVVLGILIAVLGLVMAIFSQKLIDDILPSQDADKLVLGIVLVTLLLIGRVLLSTARQWLMLRQSKDFNNRLMQDFFTKLLKRPKSFFDTRKIGDLTTRLHDTSRIQRVISQLTNQVIIDVLVVVISMVFLWSYDATIAFVALACLPLIFGFIYAFNHTIISKQREAMQSFATVESNYIDTIQGITEVKTFSKISFFQKQNQEKYHFLQERLFDLGAVQVRLNLFSGLASVLFLILTLSLAAYFVFYKMIELGVLMAILSISSNILASVVNLALLLIPIQEAKVAFDRIIELEILENEPNLSNQEGTSTQTIPFSSLVLQSIAFRFPGRRQLLSDINLHLDKGELITLSGESGSGKSTLLQIIAGFYQPESGQILLNGQRVHSLSPTTTQQKIIYLPQYAKLFSANVIQNISLDNSSKSEAKVISFCKNKGFNALFEQFPQAYQTLLGENGVHLSGGQRQLIALARALYHQPELLLLDEATASLDTVSEQYVVGLLKSLLPSISILWVTHKPEIAKIGDRHYHLEHGTLQSAPLSLYT
ncbi:MAG: peptidase domain-containing ABC transporter [Saprospiraceae bacterium]|nr:peptidase domain-containing ABC transporter [Saprospiraceae bacterium]